MQSLSSAVATNNIVGRMDIARVITGRAKIYHRAQGEGQVNPKSIKDEVAQLMKSNEDSIAH